MSPLQGLIGITICALKSYPIPRPLPQRAREGELNSREHAV